MLATLTELLDAAEKGDYAVVAPDFTSLFAARVMVETAEQLGTPLILSFAPALKPLVELSDYERYMRAVLDEIESMQVPICLHLDHASSLDEIREAIDVGFTSVMMDASREPWERNLELTQQTVALAKPAGVSVEAELGQVSTGSDYFVDDQLAESLTDPDEAGEFVRLTGIDALAVAIGNQHGAYRGAPKLDFERLAALQSVVDVPLVLHGSSGIPEADLKRAIGLGIRKINLFSEIIAAAHQGMLGVLQESLSDPFALQQAQAEETRDVLKSFIAASGSQGKA